MSQSASPQNLRMSVSDSGNVAADELYTSTGEGGVLPRYGSQMMVSMADASTALEFQGTKVNQRSELSEHTSSSGGNQKEGDVWYGVSIYIDPVTQLPTYFADGPEANLVLFQFHERSTPGNPVPPAMVIELNEDGNLVALFGTGVGKREYILVDGGFDGTDAIGQWIDLVFRVDWADDATGEMDFYVREEGEAGYTLEATDTGQNTVSNDIYVKAGVYRNFLERDADLQASTTKVFYDGLMRGDSFSAVTSGFAEGPLSGSDYDDTIRGDTTDELINGNDGDDLIEGGGGNDVLEGQDGNDTLLGGAGDDLLDGGKDQDSLSGNDGDDTLLGGADDDVLIGGAGNDLLMGGTGDDLLEGGDGNDVLHGEASRDILFGGAGDDFVFGGSSNDTLEGGTGDDVLDGGNSRDWLTGGQGADTLTGGEGWDYFIFRTGDLDGSTDTVTDFTYGPGEKDRFDFTDLGLLGLYGSRTDWAVANISYATSTGQVVVDLGSGSLILVNDWENLGTGLVDSVISASLL